MTWKPTGFGAEIQEDRYGFGESWDESCYRVARHVASVEHMDVSRWSDEFAEVLGRGLFSPGGRIWYGAGRPNAQLLNCFVLPIGDSREGWGQLFYDTTVVSGTGGGIGVNFGAVRGRGYPIRGTGGSSTGAVSVMRMQSGLGKGIVQGGSRRTALMQSLPLNHPDIREFINAKKGDVDAITNANHSIVIPKNMRTGDFVNAIDTGRDIPLEFEGRHNGESINAAEMWETIVNNAWTSGEPGVLNGHLANRESNIGYAHDLSTTNPCGEIWLPEYGCCCLGALVLSRFVRGGSVDWSLLDATIRTAVRFLDDVLSVNHYPLPAIKSMAQAERRIGLGVMGLHTMLLELGMKYSESVPFIDELFHFIRDSAYMASVHLSLEKGPFPLYNQQFLASDYARRLPRSIRTRIKAHGIRNCALLTIAPTGTTSIVQGVTGGIEPMYAPIYWRRVMKEGEVLDKTLVVSKEFANYPSLVEGAMDIEVETHFQVQATAQFYVDNAVSKSVNMAKDYPVENLSAVWKKYLHRLKGSTLYREGSRPDEPMEHIPLAESWEVMGSWDGKVENKGGLTVEACKNGVCEL